MNNSLDFDESIYETEEFKKHETLVLPEVKDICMQILFFKNHHLLIESLRLHQKLDARNESQNKITLMQMFEDFKTDAEHYLNTKYTYDEVTINYLITNYEITKLEIRNCIETRKIDLRNYIIKNNISKPVIDTFFHPINTLENS